MSDSQSVNAPVEQAEEDRDERRGAAWLPWVVFVIIVLIVAWLIWKYADFGDGRRASVTRTDVITSVVPDVVGLSEADAADKLEDAGYGARSEDDYTSDQPEGTVVNQEPAAGIQYVRGNVVIIEVSAGVGSSTGTDSVIPDNSGGVPDVLSMSEDLAVQALKRAGYRVTVGYAYSDAAKGTVFSQTPAPGEFAESGTTVHIIVSLGQRVRRVAMPNVVGLTESAAKSKISAAGLSPRPTYQPKNDKVGRVYQQSPAAGTVLDEGTLVFYLIGTKTW